MTFSPVLALMKEAGAPLTRDEYLRFNNLGKKTKVSPEEEAELPTRFAYPVVTHEELPEPKTAAPGKETGKTSKGPVKHFNGKVFPNPKGVKPMLDTERPAAKPATVKMDVSNPSAASFAVNPMDRVQ